MNDERFKTEYQRSENSVPVNTELKKRLIAAAREYERSEAAAPEITISHTAQRKRVRRIITELSALAACAALCAYTIPKISSQYFDRSAENELISSTERPEEPERAKPDSNLPEPRDDASDGPSVPAENNTEKAAKANTDIPKINAGAAAPPAGASRLYAAEHDTSDEGKADYIPPDTDTEYSKSELDTRLGTIAKNSKKLESWNDTLAPYKSDDDTISGYYRSFSQSVSKYAAAADDFEKSYGSASDSGQIYEGIEKYDAELDGILFETCRADYRKAKNYIEMNLADYEAEETEAAEETEGAE